MLVLLKLNDAMFTEMFLVHIHRNDNYRCGDIILLSSVTQVNPVSKGGDHVESEGVEKAQGHLEIIWINTFLSFYCFEGKYLCCPTLASAALPGLYLMAITVPKRRKTIVKWARRSSGKHRRVVMMIRM